MASKLESHAARVFTVAGHEGDCGSEDGDAKHDGGNRGCAAKSAKELHSKLAKNLCDTYAYLALNDSKA